MNFFIKFSSILFLGGAFAGLVDLQSLSLGTNNNGVSIGENPLSNLADAQELQDSNTLDRLGEMGKEEVVSLSETQYNPTGDAHHRDMLLNSIVPQIGFGCPSSVSRFRGREDVKFVLYNKNYPRGVDISDDLGAGKLIKYSPIKFLIHGFLNSENSMMVQVVKNAYMQRPEDINVIAVDWTKGSGTWLTNYFNCLITARIVPKVGEAVATFIQDLVEQQEINILYINVIGHSLGAHIAGRAGKKVQELLKRPLPIIVGLDPALPSFQYNPANERLDASDALYVEVIHTNPGDLGFETPLGTSDFYPNYGLIKRNRQPSCITPACSHAMSFRLFAESIVNPFAFEAYSCTSYDDMKNGNCVKRQGTQFADMYAYMGGADMRFGKKEGVFKLETNKFAPFGNHQ